MPHDAGIRVWDTKSLDNTGATLEWTGYIELGWEHQLNLGTYGSARQDLASYLSVPHVVSVFPHQL